MEHISLETRPLFPEMNMPQQPLSTELRIWTPSYLSRPRPFHAATLISSQTTLLSGNRLQRTSLYSSKGVDKLSDVRAAGQTLVESR